MGGHLGMTLHGPYIARHTALYGPACPLRPLGGSHHCSGFVCVGGSQIPERPCLGPPLGVVLGGVSQERPGRGSGRGVSLGVVLGVVLGGGSPKSDPGARVALTFCQRFARWPA